MCRFTSTGSVCSDDDGPEGDGDVGRKHITSIQVEKPKDSDPLPDDRVGVVRIRWSRLVRGDGSLARAIW